MKKIIQGSALGLLCLASAGAVYAHVTVNPKQAVVGYGVASVRVPNEKDMATMQVRILIPEGAEVNGVMPIPGWTHTEKKEAMKPASGAPAMSDDGDAAATDRISEVTWIGGKIAPGEFMEFPLSVQYSAEADTLTWKAYQTYANGEVVAWDGSGDKHPAPVITVLKEAKTDVLEKEVRAMKTGAGAEARTPWLSVAAVILSVAALAVSSKRK